MKAVGAFRKYYYGKASEFIEWVIFKAHVDLLIADKRTLRAITRALLLLMMHIWLFYESE